MEADTIVLIVTIVGSILGSTLTTITLLLGQVNPLDDRLGAMGRDVSDARETLARIEGHLIAPEGFQPHGRRPTAPDEDPVSEPDQAG